MTQHTPLDGIQPYTRTVHNRVEGYRLAQADYAPLLAVAEEIETVVALAEWPSYELLKAGHRIAELGPMLRAAIALARRTA